MFVREQCSFYARYRSSCTRPMSDDVETSVAWFCYNNKQTNRQSLIRTTAATPTLQVPQQCKNEWAYSLKSVIASWRVCCGSVINLHCNRISFCNLAAAALATAATTEPRNQLTNWFGGSRARAASSRDLVQSFRVICLIVGVSFNCVVLCLLILPK